MGYGIRQLELSDEKDETDIIVNATGISIEAFTWPEFSDDFYDYVRVIISNILIISVTLIISQKCLLLKLTKTAEHTFYCTVALVFCLSEALLLSHQVYHMALGLLAFGLGAMGVGIEIRHKQLLVVKHFRSKHSIFGLIGSLLIVATIATGFWMLVQDICKKYAIILHLGHRICGLTSYVALMTSQLFSYTKGFVCRNWSELHIRILKGFTFIATITVCSMELKHFAVDVLATIQDDYDIIPKANPIQKY